MKKYNLMAEYIRKAKIKHKNERIEDNVKPNLLNRNFSTDALNKAISKEKNVHGLIIHSDQGFQYTSYEYKATCESNGIQISMSRKGTPIDDSPIESWHSLLKKETLYNNNITSLQEYIQLVEEWILFYNTTRLKSKVKKKRKNYTKREK